MSVPLKKSVPHLGKIIPAEHVRILEVPEESVPDLQPSATASAEKISMPHQAEIVLLRDGARVKTIVVKCACGQVTTLDCDY